MGLLGSKHDKHMFKVKNNLDDLHEYILEECFDLCGCKHPESDLALIGECMLLLLYKHDMDHEEYSKWCENIGRTTVDIIHKLLHQQGMEEHGGIVGGWLSLKGEEILQDIIDELGKEELEQYRP